MTKADLIATVAKEVNIPKATAEKTLNAFANAITKILKKGDKLTLTGFGTFYRTKSPKRKGRNPQTNQEILIPARFVAKFKQGNVLKNTINPK
jgi:DNA-binding protein HU-beta